MQRIIILKIIIDIGFETIYTIICFQILIVYKLITLSLFFLVIVLVTLMIACNKHTQSSSINIYVLYE